MYDDGWMQQEKDFNLPAPIYRRVTLLQLICANNVN